MSHSQVMNKSDSHAHEHFQGSPFQMQRQDLLRLSKTSPWPWFGAVIVDWSIIALSIYLSEKLRNPLVYLCAVIMIGARQHGLGVLMHDAIHYRVFRAHKSLSDLISDVLCAWPIFEATDRYRYTHTPHHKYLNTMQDPDREFHGTHNADGTTTDPWTFPMTKFKLLRHLAIEVVASIPLYIQDFGHFLKIRDRKISYQSSGILVFISQYLRP